MTAKISLTQFLNFSAKVHTDAKINYVRKVKNSDYAPGADYYLDLRQAIHRYTQGKASLDSIIEVAESSKEDRRANFVRDATKFVQFMGKHEIEFFDVGSAHWDLSDRLTVSASPEFGMICDGERYAVKDYFRKKDPKDKITLRKLRPSLTLMRKAETEVPLNGANAAILNLQNGKLIVDDKPVDDSALLQLQIDAANFADIWENI